MNSAATSHHLPQHRQSSGLRSALTFAAASPHALSLLALCAFLDALILPLPISAILVPLCTLAPHRRVLALLVTILAGQIGAAGSFLLGFYICPQIMNLPLLSQLAADFTAACTFYSAHLAAVSALLYPLLPLPYCLGSLAAGSFNSAAALPESFPSIPLALYLICSTLGRLLRFSLFLELLRRACELYKRYIRHKHVTP